ncbi:MAG: hypothetical protein Q7K57_46490 [Burkholderiaceae bacterium]|nr:hypothetical protein [Burkholderiaceae bacterium]
MPVATANGWADYTPEMTDEEIVHHLLVLIEALATPETKTLTDVLFFGICSQFVYKSRQQNSPLPNNEKIFREWQ